MVASEQDWRPAGRGNQPYLLLNGAAGGGAVP
jgi:hypothetical protein